MLGVGGGGSRKSPAPVAMPSIGRNLFVAGLLAQPTGSCGQLPGSFNIGKNGDKEWTSEPSILPTQTFIRARTHTGCGDFPSNSYFSLPTSEIIVLHILFFISTRCCIVLVGSKTDDEPCRPRSCNTTSVFPEVDPF